MNSASEGMVLCR